MTSMTNTDSTRPDFNSFSREAATERAMHTATCNPLAMDADDGATVLHVFGTNPVTLNYEDIYVAIGGAQTDESVDAMYAPSPYQARIVAVFFREGDTCAEAVKKAAVHS